MRPPTPRASWRLCHTFGPRPVDVAQFWATSSAAIFLTFTPTRPTLPEGAPFLTFGSWDSTPTRRECWCLTRHTEARNLRVGAAAAVAPPPPPFLRWDCPGILRQARPSSLRRARPGILRWGHPILPRRARPHRLLRRACPVPVRRRACPRLPRRGHPITCPRILRHLRRATLIQGAREMVAFGNSRRVFNAENHLFSRGGRLRVGWLNGFSFIWEGCRESRRCSRDTFPESYITK